MKMMGRDDYEGNTAQSSGWRIVAPYWDNERESVAFPTI
jgi:hypothetical protein